MTQYKVIACMCSILLNTASFIYKKNILVYIQVEKKTKINYKSGRLIYVVF